MTNHIQIGKKIIVQCGLCTKGSNTSGSAYKAGPWLASGNMGLRREGLL